MEPTYDTHTSQVQEVLHRASISKNSMLESEQIYAVYDLLDEGEWETMSADAIRDRIMRGKSIVEKYDEMDMWDTRVLPNGTGCVCPECESKLIVNFDALDGKDRMACIYCDTVSLLPDEL